MNRNQRNGSKPFNRNQTVQQPANRPRLTPQQKEDQILGTINQATNEEPVTYKGLVAKTNFTHDEVRHICDRLLNSKQINQVLIPDAHFPTQKVRAFFRKF
jgi:hypothetical protein